MEIGIELGVGEGMPINKCFRLGDVRELVIIGTRGPSYVVGVVRWRWVHDRTRCAVTVDLGRQECLFDIQREDIHVLSSGKRKQKLDRIYFNHRRVVVDAVDIAPFVAEYYYATLELAEVGAYILLRENRHELENKLWRDVADGKIRRYITFTFMKGCEFLEKCSEVSSCFGMLTSLSNVLRRW